MDLAVAAFTFLGNEKSGIRPSPELLLARLATLVHSSSAPRPFHGPRGSSHSRYDYDCSAHSTPFPLGGGPESFSSPWSSYHGVGPLDVPSPSSSGPFPSSRAPFDFQASTLAPPPAASIPYIPVFSSQALGTAYRLRTDCETGLALAPHAALEFSDRLALELTRSTHHQHQASSGAGDDRDAALSPDPSPLRKPRAPNGPSIALGVYAASCPASSLLLLEAWESPAPPPAAHSIQLLAGTTSTPPPPPSQGSIFHSAMTPWSSLAGSVRSSRNSSMHGGGSLHGPTAGGPGHAGGGSFGLPPAIVPGPRGLPIELPAGALVALLPDTARQRVLRGEMVGGMHGMSIAQVLPIPLSTGADGGGIIELVVRTPGGFTGAVTALRPVLWFSGDPAPRRPQVLRWTTSVIGWGLPRVSLLVEGDDGAAAASPCVARLALEEWSEDGAQLLSLSNVLSIPVLPSPLVTELRAFNQGQGQGMDDAPILYDLTALLSMATEASARPLPQAFVEAAHRLELYASRAGRRHLEVLVRAVASGRRIHCQKTVSTLSPSLAVSRPGSAAAGRAGLPSSSPISIAAHPDVQVRVAMENEGYIWKRSDRLFRSPDDWLCGGSLVCCAGVAMARRKHLPAQQIRVIMDTEAHKKTLYLETIPWTLLAGPLAPAPRPQLAPAPRLGSLPWDLTRRPLCLPT